MILQNIIDLFLHLDKNLGIIINNYGILAYLILFLIVFCETGLVVTPFLPGDSLLFASGALSAIGMLNIWILMAIFYVAAIIGDSLNYWIGNKIGGKVFTENSRLFKKSYLIKAQQFYEKHGGKTIILARFIPIIRTFAPFVAGIGKMQYKKFFLYNIVGAVVWVSVFLLAGFFFGTIPLVKNNFTIIIYAIIVISIIPAIVEIIRHKLKKS